MIERAITVLYVYKYRKCGTIRKLLKCYATPFMKTNRKQRGVPRVIFASQGFSVHFAPLDRKSLASEDVQELNMFIWTLVKI